MQFLELRLGDGELRFEASNTARLPFSFPAPVSVVHPMLAGFSFTRDGGDMEASQIQVELTPLFNTAESPTDGIVQIDFKYLGSSFEVISSPHLVRAKIRVLLLGV